MFTFRTSRTRPAATARLATPARLAAAALVCGLSLTACGPGSGAQDEGASTTTVESPAPGAASSGSGANSSAGSTKGSGSSDAQQGAGKQGSGAQGSGAQGSGKQGAGEPVADARHTAQTQASKAPASSSGRSDVCDGSNTRTVAAPLNRPVNHMLLTVTNTGAKTCYLYGYPAVRFGEAQAVPPVIAGSMPQAVVTLRPGESGYASVNLSAADGSAANGHTVKTLTVYFQGASLSGSTGTPAHPSLPAQGVYVDDSLKVTYWQQSMNDATSW